MFSYYGSKTKLAHLYPAPIYPTIIEPFAGAAAYSLHSENWRHNVILYDAYPKIAAIWEYLINASEKEILQLPDLRPGDKVTDYSLTDAERWLIGFSINRGSSVPKITASSRSARYRERIIKNLYKVKHWKINCSSFTSCPNIEATWFIDPPYQLRGKYYFGHSKINYPFLAEWCRSRQGQVIVCENEGADWLPFRHLADFHGMSKNNAEVIWVNKA